MAGSSTLEQPSGPIRERLSAWCYAALAAATLIAYWPALTGQLIWDDAGHVTRPDLRSLHGLWRIWTELGATQQYYPVLHTAFWIEHRLWGDATVGYHLINVAFHVLSACLLVRILQKLAIPGAWLAGLLFALHPVCVESVAWISEQKNTLSGVFYFAAALAYLRFDERRRPRDYALATALFMGAMLSKSVTVTLPAALLVVFWWKRGRLDPRRDGVPLLPWFGAGLVMSATTSWVEHRLIGASGAAFGLSAFQRVLLAARALWFYAGKVLWPSDLTFIYPKWTVAAADPVFVGSLIGVLAVFGALAWLAVKRDCRGPLAAALYFTGTLFPALGFVEIYPFRYSYVADHFQYLACLGILVPVAALAAYGLKVGVGPRRWGRLFWAGAALIGGGGAASTVLTWNQCGMYRDVVSLYRTTLVRNPSCWMAEGNWGSALVEAGQVAEAVPHFERALRLEPKDLEAENSLGDALNRLGRAQEALPHLQHVVREAPRFADAHNNLGAALMMTGHAAEGIAEFREALRLEPAFTLAEVNLGLALASSGKPEEALPYFETAGRRDPANANAALDWAIALTVLGRPADALPHFADAVRLAPNSADAHLKYGMALRLLGREQEAEAQLAEAGRLTPPSENGSR